MTSSNIAQNVQIREGWTDTTLLNVVLDYIDGQENNEIFLAYLNERSADETEDENEDQCQHCGLTVEKQNTGFWEDPDYPFSSDDARYCDNSESPASRLTASRRAWTCPGHGGERSTEGKRS